MSFNGAIFAEIGADTKDYDKAMARIASSTKQAFDTAAKTAMASSSQMVQQIGQLMSRLSVSSASLGSRVGQGLTGGYKIALGELQRIASNIGAKIPEPIRAGFAKLVAPATNALNQISGNVSAFVAKTRGQLEQAFDIGKVRSMFAKAATGADTFVQNVSTRLDGLVGVFARVADKLPGPFGAAFGNIASKTSVLNSTFTAVGAKLSNALGQQVLNPALQSWNTFFSAVSTKANTTADKISNSFGGKLISKITDLSTKLAGTLSNGFSTLATKATSSLNSISANVMSLGNSITKTTLTVTALGAAFAVFQGFKATVVGSVQKAADFESKLSNIKALTGATATEMSKYNAAALKAGADTAFSASEAADGIAELLKAGVSTTAILNGGLTGALNLATAGGLSLAESAEVASTALNAFKSDNLSIVAVANQLAGAANASATDVHELRHGLSMVSAVASGVGMSFKDTTNALAVFAQNGLKGSDAGTSLKTMLMRLQPQTKAQVKAMQSLGIITDDGANKFFTAEGKVKSFAEISQVLQDSLEGLNPAQRQMALQTMFGSDAVRAATIAMKEGAAGANAMQEAISKVTAAEVAKEKLNNLKGAVEYLSGSFETLQIKIGTAVLPVLTSLVKWMDKLVDRFSNSAGLQNFLDSLTAITPAIDHFLNGTKLTTAELEKAKSAFVNLAPAVGTLIGAFTIGPILSGLGGLGVVLGGLGAKVGVLGGVFGTTFGHLSGLVGVLASRMTGLSGVFATAASHGLSVLGTMTSSIASVASIALASIGPAAILGLVVAGLGLVNSQFGSQIDQLLNVATTRGPEIITKLVSGITSKMPQLIASGADLIAKLANSFATLFPVIVQAGGDLVSSLVNGVGRNAGSLISSAITIVGSFVQSILTALPQLLSLGMNFLANVVQGIVQNIPQLMSTAQQILNSFMASLSSHMPNILAKGIEILQNLVTGAIQMLPTLIQMAGQIVTSLMSGLTSHLPMLLQGGVQLIVSLVQGLIQNLPTMIQTATQVLQSFLGGLVQSLPQLIAAGIQLVVQLAGAIIMGLPDIIVAGIQLILGLGQAMLEALPQALSGVWEGIKNGFSGVWDWVTGKNKEGAESTKAAITQTSDAVSAKTSEMATTAGVNMQQLADSVKNSMNATNLAAVDNAGQMASGVIGQANQMADKGTTEVSRLAGGYTQQMAAAKQKALAEADAMSNGVVQKSKAMSTGVDGSLNAINNSVSGGMSRASTTAQSGAQKIANSTQQGFDKAKSSADKSMSGISQSTSQGMAKINTAVTNGANKAQQTFTQTFDRIKSQTQSAMSSLTSQFQSGMTKVASLSQTTGQRVTAVFAALQGQLAQAGAQAGAGFANGLAGQAGNIMAVANSIASSVAATIRKALDIHSPSRVTDALGGFTGEGFYNGMAGWLGSIRDLSKDYAQAVVDQKYGVDSHITTSGHITSQGVSSSLEALSDDVKNSQLATPVFEVHNEIVGDEIYTTIKEREAREAIRDEFFAYDY